MNIRAFQEADYPAVVAIHKSLNISWPERPPTPEGWAEIDRNRNPKYKFKRWVILAGGKVAGFGSHGHGGIDYHPQRFYVNVEISPAYQRRGLGAALYDHLWAELQPCDPRVLRADAFTNLPQGFAFLQRRGFYEAFRETPVQLDITAFDPSPYAGLEARLREQGILIKTLPELKFDPDRDRKIYDLYWEATEDVPQEEPRIVAPDFDEWVQWSLNDPSLLPGAFFVALRGEEYVGVRELYKDPDNNVLLGGLLGVRRACRQQGIGLALQLRGIAYGREHGYPALKTCTGVENAAMQALFDKLGYARGPEWQQCQKDIYRSVQE